MKKIYLPKYPISSDESFTIEEKLKLVRNLQRHTNREFFIKALPKVVTACILVLYLIMK